MHRLVAISVVMMGVLTVASAQQTNDNPGNSARESVPGQLLVQFKPGAAEFEKSRALGRIQAQVLEDVLPQLRREDNRGDLVLVHHPPEFAQNDARRELAADPAVEFAEPNWIYTHQATSNDPLYTGGSLWGMYGDGSSPANMYGSQAGEAWAAGHTGISTVYVGVIDEGIQYTHEDLSANMWVNSRDPVDGVDNDGNGYIDDVRGWDFDRGNNSIYDGTQDNHGTHVAGTIGAVGGNGRGVAGVNWNVKIITAKFLGRRGGTTANAVKAIDYITDLKTRQSLNIVATNNSWGGGGFSQSLKDAIDRAGAKNILFIAAAGNGGSDGVGDNTDSVPHYPSSYTSSNIISVASITSTGARSGFSNYGASSVDLGAPGSGIYSTVPNSAGNSYGSYSGTSMATPHVTGAAALYASTHPGVSAATIKTAILSAVVPTPSLSGRCVTGGRLNVSSF